MRPRKLLSISDLARSYRDGSANPHDVISEILDHCDAADPNIWIERVSRESVFEYIKDLKGKDLADLPLFGIPFAIKDNIDLEGIPTTAGCPAYSYTPEESSTVVSKLIAAGAIPIGKTNLDQFATGLVGIRSPYSFPSNPYNDEYIPGGSSSGSAVAVASGLVCFALGTDTAGSGRVPASLNNLVGLKPSKGLVSCKGVVPACRSLDCVTVFSGTVEETSQVLSVIASYDCQDPYSRAFKTVETLEPAANQITVGVPKRDQLEFFGNTEAANLFEHSTAHCTELGWTIKEIDLEPFLEAARLLYEGPWVAERLAAIESFFHSNEKDIFPVTAKIIGGAKGLTAVEAFKAEYRLRSLKKIADEVWENVDVIMTPTLGTPYTVEEVNADPIQLNSNLGYYTNFMNLLDYAAIAVPAGFLEKSKMPWGVTFFTQAFRDPFLLRVGSKFHETKGTLDPIQTKRESGIPPMESLEDRIEVAVCGAHLSGLPLNHQLTTRGAHLVQSTKTAPVYRMFSLPASESFPERPGLTRDEKEGRAIDIEIWSVPASGFGSFVEAIGAPLGIGKLLTEDNREVSGFICESYAVAEATEITEFGSWRNWLAR